MDRYTRPHSVVQTPHTAPYAMELLLTFNRSDHPMFAPLRFLKVEESPRLIVAFFTYFSHIHQLFHLVIRSFSDTTVFLNIRSHVAYLLVEVDTKQKKNTCPTLSNCAHLRSECRASNCNLQDRVVRAGQKSVGVHWRGTEWHPMSIFLSGANQNVKRTHAIKPKVSFLPCDQLGRSTSD